VPHGRPTDYAALDARYPDQIDNPKLVPFAALNTQKQHFVTYRARGYSLPQSAELAQIPYNTAASWNRLPWCIAAVKERQAQVQNDRIATLAPLLPPALDSLRRSLEGEAIEAERGTNARFLIDHIFGRPTTRSEGHSRNEIAVVSPDDVLRALDRLNGLGVAIDADYQQVDAEADE
jgi:hypothetical protein